MGALWIFGGIIGCVTFTIAFYDNQAFTAEVDVKSADLENDIAFHWYIKYELD